MVKLVGGGSVINGATLSSFNEDIEGVFIGGRIWYARLI